MANLKLKLATARGKIYVDVGFWGGIIPSNTADLEALIGGGVIGLQCSLSPAAEPVGKEFPAINKQQLDTLLTNLDNNIVIAVHCEEPLMTPIKANEDEPKCYESFLRTRPSKMEVNAVQIVTDLALRHKKYFLFTLKSISFVLTGCV